MTLLPLAMSGSGVMLNWIPATATSAGGDGDVLTAAHQSLSVLPGFKPSRSLRSKADK
jgi:hypothetical protein